MQIVTTLNSNTESYIANALYCNIEKNQISYSVFHKQVNIYELVRYFFYELQHHAVSPFPNPYALYRWRS